MAKKSNKKKGSKKPADAPKQRTRQHIIASLSTNHVERMIYERGWAAQRVENDYGFDLIMQTFTAQGYVEAGFVLLQLKAKDKIVFVDNDQFVSFTISVSDYRTWTEEAYPVFLVVYDAINKVAYWLYIQKYFEDDPSREPGDKATTVTVRIPLGNVFNDATLTYMKGRKEELMAQFQPVKHG
jgi:hypothetical protein